MTYQTTVQPTGFGAALAVANPWSMVPSLGNLDAYISVANRLPCSRWSRSRSLLAN